MSAPAPNKLLGQHYLHDPNLKARIAAATGAKAGHTVLEIGPGPGALTEELLKLGATVVAIEKDARFLEPLAALSAQYENRLTVHHADALHVKCATLVPKGSVLAGNLPYNVGTQIVFNAITQERYYFEKMVFLLQKEVVQRMCGSPKHASEWGRLGVWCDLYMHRKRLFDVPPGAFNPPPKVMSSVVELIARDAPLTPVEPKNLAKLLELTFGQRRKMLRKTLKNLITEEQFAAVHIPPTARPETLTTQQLCTLANLLEGI